MAESWPVGILRNGAILDENEKCLHVRQRIVLAKG